jgi:hypothetical protein
MKLQGTSVQSVYQICLRRFQDHSAMRPAPREAAGLSGATHSEMTVTHSVFPRWFLGTAWMVLGLALLSLVGCTPSSKSADNKAAQLDDERFSVDMPAQIPAVDHDQTASVQMKLVSQPQIGRAGSEPQTPVKTEPAESALAMPASMAETVAETLPSSGEASDPTEFAESAKSVLSQVSAKPDAQMGEMTEPETYQDWDKPDLTLVFTGNQHGYIEPCGCTGLERQKGGVARRYTFLETLREKGWTLVPMDVGNQVRRTGQQANIKLQQSARALQEMKYQAVGFGPEDVRLGVGPLLAVAASDAPEDALYVSANVVLFDPEMMPATKIVQQNGLKVGVTSILDPEGLTTDTGEELQVGEMVPAAKAAIRQLSASTPDFTVLLFYGKEEAAQELMQEVAGFDLVVVAGGYGEPTYQPADINDSQTQMILTGAKGMYAGLVGLYAEQKTPGDEGNKPDLEAEPTTLAKTGKPTFKYGRVPLTHDFADAPAMRGLMKDYQDQLESIGLEGLGLMPPIPHPSGNKFVGTATCGKCHTEALDVWEGSPHAFATDSIVEPPEDRGDVPRHFDPECISCHVTGWNPQDYYPYETGYLSLEKSQHLLGSGCENCHGPGAEHSAAEEEGSTVSEQLRDQLREAMRLPLEKAREKCITCHDLDNSIDFHEEGAFEHEYWPQVEHYGMD